MIHAFSPTIQMELFAIKKLQRLQTYGHLNSSPLISFLKFFSNFYFRPTTQFCFQILLIHNLLRKFRSMQSNSNLFFLNLQEEYDWGFQSSASSLHSHEVQLLHLHHPSSLDFTPNDHLLLQQILHSFHHEDLVLQSSSQPLETDQNSENQIIVTDEASDKTEPKSYKKQKNMRLNSPFHNYQKHLNTALRKIMVVPDMSQCSDYRQAAFELWTQFKVSKIKNKKILHFIFNQTNTYTISQCELKNYGFYNVYLKYGMNTLNLAKQYLSKLTIEQLDDITISECVNAGKITNRESFKEYMTTFRAELEEGQLKRRIKK